MSIRYGLYAVTLAVIVAVIALGGESSSKLDRALTERLSVSDAGSVRVIVTAQSGFAATVTQAIRAHGGAILSAYMLPRSVTATVPTAHLRALARDRRVAGVSLDAPVQSMTTGSGETAPGKYRGLMLATMGLSGNALPVGDGVGIAIIDSGFESARAQRLRGQGCRSSTTLRAAAKIRNRASRTINTATARISPA